MRTNRSLILLAGLLMALSLAQPVHGTVNVCWELAEPLWVPPTPLDAAECTRVNWPICFFLPHCCGPTCRLHPECTLGGTFVEGHWETLECRAMEPEVALEQFLRGLLRPADDFLEPIRQAAVIQIEGLTRDGRPIPDHVQRLLNTLMGSRLLARQPQFRPGHVARARLVPERQPTADLYLQRATTEAITLDNLIILRNASFDAIYAEPPRTADDLYCGRVSSAFANAISLLMHELVHVRQWDVLGRDTFLNNYLLEVLTVGYGSDAFESEAFRLSNFVDAQLVDPDRSESHGWVFSELARFSGTRTPSTGSVNSADGTNTVTRTGLGAYRVRFGGLSVAMWGNAQVSAGRANRSCKPSGWVPWGTDLDLGVRCFDTAGNPADSPFFATVEHLARRCSGTSYLWSDRLTGRFEPNAGYSHSQSLRPNIVARTATGRYTATLPGLGGSGGHAQVSAYGGDTARCQIVSWGIGGGIAVVNVACFDPAGAPVDARFSLQFSNGDVVGRMNRWALENAGVYLWANRPTASSPYTPSETYRFSDREGVILFDAPTVERLGRGRYRTSLPGYAAEVGKAALQISAYGSRERVCSVLGATAVGERAQIDVVCTGSDGRPADSLWTLMFATNAAEPFF